MTVPHRFVHVGFYFAGTVPVAEIEKVFATAVDWLRYDQHCWILYTNTEVNVWRDRLKAVPAISTGEFFLCEINNVAGSGYSGWMKQTTWDWMNKH
jgi:hypothetical protein